MKTSNKSKRIGHMDLVLAKNILHLAFPEELNLKSLKMVHAATQSPDEVMLSNNELTYSISKLSGKYNDDKHERWIYQILRTETETNNITWRYAHPNTNEVYEDLDNVPFSSLPIVS